MNKSSLDQIDCDLIDFWKKLKYKPTVIVFDLDYTLWPNYIDNFSEFASKEIESNGEMSLKDSYGNFLKSYPEITKLLKTLKENCLFRNQYLAIASRAHSRELALQALEYFDLKNYFSSFQIYPLSKVEHMNEIKKELKLKDFNQILFFDDENRNIVETSDIGVLACLVSKSAGFNRIELINGLNEFNNRQLKKEFV